ncbi:aspartate--tRNA(Asn) ligase [Candidatus Kaiserbacteria bacterium]|nr:aspartate--tRNA(Asn) ligase [Candidatus Kaiserbacteria bacterium]
MQRTSIVELGKHIGETVSISGWVDVRRDHGKLVFLDIRDRSGKVQVICQTNHAEALVEAQALRPEWAVQIKGVVNERPEKMRTEEQNGGLELEATNITVLARAQELPFEKDTEVNLDTYLDHLPLTLRSERARAIFKVQAEIVNAYRGFLALEGFTEFQAPALVGGDAEGGAAAFTVNYYYDQKAYLATSPQLYKQIMVGAFERVFATPKVFRGEKHATTRHLSEYSSLDFEMGFITDHQDVMAVLMRFMHALAKQLGMNCAQEFKTLGAALPDAPEEFPTLKLREAQKILGVGEGPDLEPEQERAICEWAKKEKGSDFVFITHYPVKKRPFYTYEDENDPGFTKSFDLLLRGLEISTGGQRVHDYDTLVQKARDKGLDPGKFSFYLQAFKYGMPPHGGSATGLERLTARLLNLPNVKEATLFPRDINRIDTLLSNEADI